MRKTFIYKVLILKVIIFMACLHCRTGIAADDLSTIISPALFKNHSAIMLIIDPESGDIVQANDAAALFYGFNVSELEKKSIQQINIFTNEQVAQERAAARTEGRNYFVFKHRLASGDMRTVSVYSTPFNVNGKTQLLSVIHDISSQRSLEKELWRYQENLEELIRIQIGEIEKKQSDQLLLAIISIALLCVLLLILSVLATRLRRAKRAAQQDSSKLQAIFDSIDDLLIFAEPNQRISAANKKAQQILTAKMPLFGRFMYEFEVSQTLSSDAINEHEYKGAEGNFWGEYTCTKVVDNDARHLGSIHFIHDISERIATRRQQRLASTVFATTNEGVFVSNGKNEIIMVNRAFINITGYSQDDALGKTPSLLNSGRHNSEFFKAMYLQLNTQGQWEGEIWNRRKDGCIYPCWLSIAVVFDDTKNIEMFVAILNDISLRKENEQEMWLQTNLDTLTGLPNRQHFYNKVDQQMLHAQAEQKRLAICFIDLDRFKSVNDTLGHATGDLLLLEASKRIKACMSSGNLVARLGGDEFSLLLTNINTVNQIEHIALKVLNALNSPFVIAEHEVFVSGSMGITLYPDDGLERKILIRNADSAMYKAKEKGRNCFEFFTPGMHEQAQARSQLEGALHKALSNNEFTIHYQPIISIDGERLGCEALLRWYNPELGHVSPADFIPICEELGLIVPIGAWVLREACQQASNWCCKLDGNFFITVNFSSVQFVRQNVSELVKECLAETGLAAECLSLEITETVLADSSDTTLKQLQAIRAQGVGLAIDDFGTGYSSLSYLKRFPLTKLKIDREFIKELPDNTEDCALVSAIISMANNLKLKVIAEGVETQEQEDFLRNLNCDYIQGFLYSKGLPNDEFELFLEANSSHIKI
ncbi:MULTISPECIES: sensor domain-containing protein [Pseudoalteromonas]|uniref:sensor domain-containing protein n=1 Tax=Pseudoalteromonas TaxID=53246 RepID=UPI000A497392|nr:MULTISPECIES: EAL domain-containing protein [Pseudoalteromonas]